MMVDSFAEAGFPAEVFQFSGQAVVDAWTIRERIERSGWSAYDRFLSHEPGLFFQRVRDLVDEFPTWERRARTGRPPVDERTHLVAVFVRQYLKTTFRETEAFLRLLRDFLRIPHVPDANTMSRKNRSRRLQHVLDRLHAFILAKLPRRKSTVSTDATGYSNGKRPWSETDYGLRATEPWIKVHAAVEVPSLLYLSTVPTKGRVHDSQKFADVWDHLPAHVRPLRSLADAAYSGEACLEAARSHGAAPLHGFRYDARHSARPGTRYEKLVNFGTHWPNRFARLTRYRKLSETTFNCTKGRFGHQLRCRHRIARINETKTKEIGHNIRMTVLRTLVPSPGF